MNTDYFTATGYGKEFLCKKISFPSASKQSFTFGSLRETCVSIAYVEGTTSAYLDRVDHNAHCVMRGTLEVKEGTEQMVRTALWSFHTLFPEVQGFTLMDDSHIFCQTGSKRYKLSLAADYVFKYGKTWYEAKFGAQLPPAYAKSYAQNLTVLDAPIESFETAVTRLGELRPFETTYRAASSPRDFVNRLRTELGRDKYCFRVCAWLHNYLKTLNIDMFAHLWTIPVSALVKPTAFRLQPTTAPPMQGGNRRSRRLRNFRLVSWSESIVGVYGEI